MRDLKEEIYYRSEDYKVTAGGWLFAILGALILGVGIPVLLVNFQHGLHSLFGTGGPKHPDVVLSFGERVKEIALLMTFGCILCSPGVAVLGSAVLRDALLNVRRGESWNKTWKNSALVGAILSFVNLPGYMCLEFLDREPLMRFLQVVVLFLVAGVTAGGWIARVAWRVVHAKDAVIPPFSLKSLIVLVLAWGVLLTIFMPR